jgi:ferritin-like metal-binding protein YciE
MANIESLEQLFVEELRDVLDAERQLTRALPRMARKASTPALRAAFEQHLTETRGQIERLDEIFSWLDMPARGKKCEGMQGLVEEGDTLVGETNQDPVRDAGLIASAQKVEHYEIATYGTLRTFANLLGYGEMATLLEQTLAEEKAADEKLTQLAEGFVNVEAAEEEESDEGEEGVATRSGRWVSTTVTSAGSGLVKAAKQAASAAGLTGTAAQRRSAAADRGRGGASSKGKGRSSKKTGTRSRTGGNASRTQSGRGRAQK